jgi:hypothetical protein
LDGAYDEFADARNILQENGKSVYTGIELCYDEYTVIVGDILVLLRSRLVSSSFVDL